MYGNRSGSGRGRSGGRHGGDGGNAGFRMGRDRADGEHAGDYAYERTGGYYGSHEQEGTPYFDGRRPLYRARDSRIMGVCKGLARYFDVRVRYVRLAFVLGAVFSGFWPVAAVYIFLGLILKPEPVIIPADPGEKDFYSAYVGSRSEAITRLREKFGRIEQRIRRMEDVVTSKEYDWERRFQEHAR